MSIEPSSGIGAIAEDSSQTAVVCQLISLDMLAELTNSSQPSINDFCMSPRYADDFRLLEFRLSYYTAHHYCYWPAAAAGGCSIDSPQEHRHVATTSLTTLIIEFLPCCWIQRDSMASRPGGAAVYILGLRCR